MHPVVLRILWLLGDVTLFVCAYVLAYFLRVGFIFSTDLRFDLYLATTLLTVPVWLCAMTATRTFSLTRNQLTWRSFAYCVFAGVFAAAVFTLFNYFGFKLILSRRLLFYILVFTTVPVWTWHVAVQRATRAWLSKHKVFRALIVGLTRESAAHIARMQKAKHPIVPVAIVDAYGTKETSVHGVPVVGKLNKLEEAFVTYGITHLVQCAHVEQSLNLLSACRQRGITYILLPSVLGIVERDETVDTLEGLPVLFVPPTRSLWNWFFR